MGRGRTTTGMVTACLIATTNAWADRGGQAAPPVENVQEEFYDSLDGPSEEEAYMQGKCLRVLPLRWGLDQPISMDPGEYKLILQLVGVLSHGKVAKKLADRAIDLMEDVQNLRKAIYPYVKRIRTIGFGSECKWRRLKVQIEGRNQRKWEREAKETDEYGGELSVRRGSLPA